MQRTDHQESFRHQLEKVLASKEFSSSRQTRDFLLYVSEAAFNQRSHVDQGELAKNVLGRSSEFNPIDDASVRRVATQTRRKLDRYYAGQGASDPVLVTLPLRSYVPVFEWRQCDTAVTDARGTDEPLPGPAEESPQPAPPKPRSRLNRMLIPAIALLALLLAPVWIWQRRKATPGEYVIATQHGDMMHDTFDLARGALLTGPKTGPVEDVAVRMRFSPEQAAQQAGLMVFASPNQYVKLGRQFTSRVNLEFGLELRGLYRKPPGTWSYDAHGQDGWPLWLLIRREQSSYRAFFGYDGSEWKPLGNVLQMSDPMPEARLAVYGYNGPSNAPATTAAFDHISAGLAFHGWTPERPVLFEGWSVVSSTPEGVGPRFAADALEFSFNRPEAYSWRLLHPLDPNTGFVVSTKIDFLPGGTIAGLWIEGTKGEFRLIRSDLNGGSLTAEHIRKNQVNIPDFPGCPPVTLRLESKDGLIRASVSRDDIKFVTLPITLNLNDLGPALRFGIQAERRTWGSATTSTTARYFYVRREITNLSYFPPK